MPLYKNEDWIKISSNKTKLVVHYVSRDYDSLFSPRHPHRHRQSNELGTLCTGIWLVISGFDHEMMKPRDYHSRKPSGGKITFLTKLLETGNYVLRDKAYFATECEKFGNCIFHIRGFSRFSFEAAAQPKLQSRPDVSVTACDDLSFAREKKRSNVENAKSKLSQHYKYSVSQV